MKEINETVYAQHSIWIISPLYCFCEILTEQHVLVQHICSVFFFISRLGLHQNDQFYIKEMLDTYIMIHIKGNTGIEGWCIFSNYFFDCSDISNYMIMVNFCKPLNQVCLYQFCANCWLSFGFSLMIFSSFLRGW